MENHEGAVRHVAAGCAINGTPLTPRATAEASRPAIHAGRALRTLPWICDSTGGPTGLGGARNTTEGRFKPQDPMNVTLDAETIVFCLES